MFLLDFIIVLFFKQKTAYEMRISNWSSDVCSSDLLGYEGIAATTPDSPSSEPEPSDQDAGFGRIGVYERREASALVCEQGYRITRGLHDDHCIRAEDSHRRGDASRRAGQLHGAVVAVVVPVAAVRSEEHTSELQSLMRISYAVFCLKKKKNI